MSDQKTILIVDDEPDIRELLVLEFELLKFRVLEAGNGKQAAEIAKKEKIDVIISDIRMPGGDGVTLLKELRQINPFSPPVILITGFADISTPQAFDAGAEAIFMKPFSLADLVICAQKALKPIGERADLLPAAPELSTIQRKWPTFPGVNGPDFSLGHSGFYIACSAPVPKRDSTATFNLDFGGGELKCLQGKGTVRWTDLNGVWVEIDALTAESHEAFKNFVLARQDIASIRLPG